MPTYRIAAAVLAVVSSAGLLGGCAGDGEGGRTNRKDVTLRVLAAASLKVPFEELATRFEDEHPEVTVELSFDSSTTLAEQVGEGAPADVLATADEQSMKQAGSSVTAPLVFATNEMVLVTTRENPGGIAGVSDLDGKDVSYVTCVATAPCGRIARQLLERNDIHSAPVSEEPDVQAALQRVLSGDVDAAMVYASDAEQVRTRAVSHPVPGAGTLLNSYVVARVKASEHRDLALGWVSLVTSQEAAAVLRDTGFGRPPTTSAP